MAGVCASPQTHCWSTWLRVCVVTYNSGWPTVCTLVNHMHDSYNTCLTQQKTQQLHVAPAPHQAYCERDPTLLPWLLQGALGTWPTPATLAALKIVAVAAQTEAPSGLPWAWLLRHIDSPPNGPPNGPSALSVLIDDGMISQPSPPVQRQAASLLRALWAVAPEVRQDLLSTVLHRVANAGPCGAPLWDLATWAVQQADQSLLACCDAGVLEALWGGLRAANTACANHPRARTWAVVRSLLSRGEGVDAAFEHSAALLALPREATYTAQRLDALHSQVVYGPQSVSCRLTSPLSIKACTLRLADVRAVKQVWGLWWLMVFWVSLGA